MKNTCFAAAPGGKCRVLLVGACPGGSCPFYKTKAQLDLERARTKASLQRLSDEDRSWIAEKYYDENKLWREIGA